MAWEQLCPVCQGRGSVPPDFYAQLGSGTSVTREQCRRCIGRGTITVQGPAPVEFRGGLRWTTSD